MKHKIKNKSQFVFEVWETLFKKICKNKKKNVLVSFLWGPDYRGANWQMPHVFFPMSVFREQREKSPSQGSLTTMLSHRIKTAELPLLPLCFLFSFSSLIYNLISWLVTSLITAFSGVIVIWIMIFLENFP